MQHGDRPEVQKLFQIYKTVTQMLYDRNYLITQQEMDLTKDEFKSKFEAAPT